jgi:putative acetyltransferase
MNPVLRRATFGDIIQILEVFKQSIEAIPDSVYTPQQKEAWIQKGLKQQEMWLEKIESQYFLVALQNKIIVGFGSLELPGYIDYLYVLSEYQNMGIAGKILGELERIAIGRQANELQTDASKAALSFFQGRGFETLKEQHQMINNIDIMNYKLIKRLQ